MKTKKRPTMAEAYLRNAGFAVVDDALPAALRKQMAAALRLKIANDRVAKGGRPAGLTEETQYVFDLVTAHPEIKGRGRIKKLHALASAERPDDFAKMPYKSFANIVGRTPKRPE